MSGLSVEIVPDSQPAVVRLIGSADLAGSEDLDRELLKLSAQRPNRLILDLSELKFVSSLAMGLLIRFAHGITNRGGTIALAGAQPLVAEALQRIKMEAVLPMYATVEEAKAG